MQITNPQPLLIPHTRPIPALLWGGDKGPLVLAVHGHLSHKADAVIAALADTAAEKKARVLSFDLPEHGDRRGEGYACTPAHAAADLLAVHTYAASLSEELCFFGCSLGAYYALLALSSVSFRRSWFLSPVVDMEQLIRRWMAEETITENRLRQEGTIPLAAGPVLDWDDYCYIRQHPVDGWSSPLSILYGKRDAITDRAVLDTFVRAHAAALQIVENGEHYFHTAEQLRIVRDWLAATWKGPI